MKGMALSRSIEIIAFYGNYDTMLFSLSASQCLLLLQSLLFYSIIYISEASEGNNTETNTKLFYVIRKTTEICETTVKTINDLF